VTQVPEEVEQEQGVFIGLYPDEGIFSLRVADCDGYCAVLMLDPEEMALIIAACQLAQTDMEAAKVIH